MLDPGPAVLTVEEAAAYLRLGLSTVYRLMGQGTIPAIKIPGTSIKRIRRAALDSLLGEWEQGRRPRKGRP